jgi:hypothetical protein
MLPIAGMLATVKILATAVMPDVSKSITQQGSQKDRDASNSWTTATARHKQMTQQHRK